MKVLLIDNFHYRRGGAEVVYLNTGDMLKEYGHEVVFFSQKWDENIPCEDSKYFPKGISTRTNSISEKIRGLIRYFSNSVAAEKLRELIRIEKPDIAHIHLFWGALSSSIYLVLKENNIPIVHTVHDYRLVCPGYLFKNGKGDICEKCNKGNYFNCVKYKCSRGLLMSAIMTTEMYWRNKYRHPSKYIDAFLYVSNFSRMKHIQHDSSFEHCRNEVLYNFRNSDVVSHRVENLDTFNSYYLFYGRLSFEKGISTLLQVFCTHPEIVLKVVGDGPFSGELKSNYKNFKNIQFLGYRSGDSLFDLVRNAKFVCVPSECYENNPMTIVESYSLRTPVIGASIGGITEIVNDGKTGFLFESGNTYSLNSVIQKAESLNNEDYCELKHNADKYADDNFDAKKYCDKLVRIYESLLSK